jgi:hypothetical protein
MKAQSKQFAGPGFAGNILPADGIGLPLLS